MSPRWCRRLPAAHRLHEGIAVSWHEIGSNSQAAAEADGVARYVL